MGLEESTGAGLDIEDISSILKGHLPDRYQVQLFVTFSRTFKIWTIDLAVVDSNYSICVFPLNCIFQFNTSAPLDSDSSGYLKSPELKDKIHCVTYVIDACKVSIMPPKLEEKLNAIRRKVNLMGQLNALLLI